MPLSAGSDVRGPRPLECPCDVDREFKALWEAFSDCVATGSYSPGKILVSQGQSARSVFRIEHGLVNVLQRRADGGDVVIGLHGPGWPIGLTAAILHAPNAVTVATLTDCAVSQVDVARFRERVASRRDLSDAVLRLQSLKLREHVARFSMILSETARKRLELLLGQLAADVGQALPDGSVRLMIPLAQNDLARAIHVTPETLSRLVADLEGDGLIARRSHRIVVVDRRLLACLAFESPST